MKKISRFSGDYSFLSNFYKTPVFLNGLEYTCVESAFQAQKCINPKDRIQFQTMDPVTAKCRGKQVELRSDWEDIKVGVMWECLIDKFTRNEDLKMKLLGTGDAYLQEGNTWRDTFWGVDLKTGKGKNKLGELLMSVRDILRDTERF